jgi:hypothetical protein
MGRDDASASAAPVRSGAAFAQVSRSTSPRRRRPPQRARDGQLAGPRHAPAQCPAEARRPIAIGLGESFSTSITVAFVFALLGALPAAVAGVGVPRPAVAPAVRRAVRPLLALAPALFATGVAVA